MRYWIINRRLIKGHELRTALYKYAYNIMMMRGAELDITVERINKKRYTELGGKL